MGIFPHIKGLAANKRTVLTAGTFDGVHEGHRTILNEVVSHAKEVGAESVLLTFEPHPRKLLFPDQPLGIITPLEKKLELLHAAGIEHVVVVPFTQEFAHVAAETYVTELVATFHPHTIIIGYDHHFGQGRSGNIRLLEEKAPAYGYELIEIPATMIDHATISSTKIRRAIEEGRMDDVTQMLGRYYSLRGPVVHGNKLGRQLGYPTANVQPENTDQIIPGRGVYAIKALHNGTLYHGMLSIGFNPTVTDRKELRIEANLFDFTGDIYGDLLEIQFVRKLRDEQKFASLEELVAQIAQDKVDTMNCLSQE